MSFTVAQRRRAHTYHTKDVAEVTTSPYAVTIEPSLREITPARSFSPLWRLMHMLLQLAAPRHIDGATPSHMPDTLLSYAGATLIFIKAVRCLRHADAIADATGAAAFFTPVIRAYAFRRFSPLSDDSI